MSKAADMLKEIKTYAPTSRDTPQKKSDWQHRCGANGCPLTPSFNGGAQLCTYHAGQDPNNWPSITESIGKNKDMINFLHRFTTMSGGELKKIFPKLIQHKQLPFDPNEDTYSGYILKLNKFVMDKIYDDASR